MKPKQKSKKVAYNLPGFSLIELALVLIVIGVLTGAVFKGKDLIDAAKIHAVLAEIDRIRTAAILYHDTFNQWPGNDASAKARFGDSVTNGQGDGIISTNESAQFWVHLAKAGHLSDLDAPTSKLGGRFSVESDPTTRKNYLILSGPEKSGLLTPKQAATLKAKAGEPAPLQGQIHIFEGVGINPGSCVRDGIFNLSTKTSNCILRVELN